VKPPVDSAGGSRLAPLGPAQRTKEQRDLLSEVIEDDAPNLLTTVVQHPALYRTWLPFCMQLLLHSVFPPRERELLILRTASLSRCAYELEHHLKLGVEMGLTDDELASLTDDGSGTWASRDRVLITAVDELHASQTISDATWRELSELLTTEQLIELPMLVGHYVLLAGMLNSLGVPLDGRPDLVEDPRLKE
jgi:AhpD family alkylhydroperoxidase